MRFEIDNSDCLSAITWKNGELGLEFVAGHKGYYLTSKAAFNQFVRALLDGASAGAWFNQHLKGAFPYRRENEAYEKCETTVFIAVSVKHSPTCGMQDILTNVQNSVVFHTVSDHMTVDTYQVYDEEDLVDDYIN